MKSASSIPKVTLADGARVPALGLGTWGMGERKRDRAGEIVLRFIPREAIRRKSAHIDRCTALGHELGQQFAGGGVIGKTARVESHGHVEPGQPLDWAKNRFSVHRKRQQSDFFIFPGRQRSVR